VRRFILGFLLGALLGGVGAAAATGVIGRNGYLLGWSVTKDGDTVCDQPFVWTATHEIECD
jgi:hypothetical protein